MTVLLQRRRRGRVSWWWKGNAGISLVRFVEVSLFLLLRWEECRCKREAANITYMKLKALSDIVDKTFGCICMRWIISEKMDGSVCGKQILSCSLIIGEWYGVEILPCVMTSLHLGSSNPPGQFLNIKL